MKRDLRLFIEDILENIDDIESFSKGLTKKGFVEDKLKQNAIIRSLEVIGEAVKNLPYSFKDNNPEIPWKIIAGFRDILTHAYFGLNLERIWNVVKDDLPELKKNIQNINEKFKNESLSIFIRFIFCKKFF